MLWFCVLLKWMCKFEEYCRFQCGPKESFTFKVQPWKTRTYWGQSRYPFQLCIALLTISAFISVLHSAPWQPANWYVYRICLSLMPVKLKFQTIKTACSLLCCNLVSAQGFSRHCSDSTVRRACWSNYLKLSGMGWGVQLAVKPQISHFCFLSMNKILG